MEHIPTPRNITKLLSTVHGLSANQGMRNDLEHKYYDHHKRINGIRLRAKYRIPQDR